MAISAVSSPAPAAPQGVQAPKPQKAESQSADATKNSQEAAKTLEAERQARQQAQNSAPPKPVVNTQGQTTGSVINVTA